MAAATTTRVSIRQCGSAGKTSHTSVAGDKAEALDLLGQLGEWKLVPGVAVQVMDTDTDEIRDHDILRQVAFLEAGEVADGLQIGRIQILATRFVFGNERAGPETVYKATAARATGFFAIAQLGDVCFEAGDPASRETEHLEKFVPEGLSLAALV